MIEHGSSSRRPATRSPLETASQLGYTADMKLWRRKVARAFIYDPEQKLFLIAKSALPPFDYHLPGGGIGRGELPEQALIRELKEELNIQPENILSILELHQIDTWVLCIPHSATIFFVTIKNPSIKLSWEIKNVKWVRPSELKDIFPKNVLGKMFDLSCWKA